MSNPSEKVHSSALPAGGPDWMISQPPVDVDWRPIPGQPGYVVTITGDVWSCRKVCERPRSTMISDTWHKLKATKNRNGYLMLRVQSRLIYIHRLLLLSFIGPCPPGQECRHLDGNRANNHRSNLCWGTSKENAADRLRHGTNDINHGMCNGMAKLTETDITEIRRLHRTEHLSHANIAILFDVNRQTITKILNGQLWKHIPDPDG